MALIPSMARFGLYRGHGGGGKFTATAAIGYWNVGMGAGFAIWSEYDVVSFSKTNKVAEGG